MGEARRRDEAEERERAEWAAEMVADAEAILAAAGVAAHRRFGSENREGVTVSGADLEERQAYMLTVATIAAHRAAGADVAAAIEDAIAGDEEDDEDDGDLQSAPPRPVPPSAPSGRRAPLELVTQSKGPLDS